MRSARYSIPATVALIAFAACGDPASPHNLVDDSALTTDVAASSGAAAAEMLETLTGDEVDAGFNLVASPANTTAGVQATRNHSCYDANGTAMNTSCLPFSSVRMIVTTASLTGSSSGTRTSATGTPVDWTVAVHRAATDTTRRNFTNTTETSRSHTATGTAKDTVTSVEGDVTRLLAITAVDSVKNITFNLPRGVNPWPTTGSFVRTSIVHAQVSKAGQSASRDLNVRVQVTFPADPQGNVTLQMNTTTCLLNLNTHAVTNCQ